MNIDAFSAIGELHKGAFCQDYYRIGLGDRPFLIVSDGCSSSPDTDVGARILVHCAQRILETSSSRVYEEEFITDILIHQVMDEAKWLAREMHLDEACLDATLLVAQFFPKKNSLAFSMTGDGFAFWKKKDKDPTIMQVEFTSNAPYYPTLATNTALKVQWKHAFPDNKMKIKQMGNKYIPMTDNSEQEPTDFNGVMSTDGLEYFGLSTDGLGSFVSNVGNLIPVESVMAEALNFKSFVGSFVQRRIGRMIKDYRAQGILNGDDISVAMMYSFEDYL